MLNVFAMPLYKRHSSPPFQQHGSTSHLPHTTKAVDVGSYRPGRSPTPQSHDPRPLRRWQGFKLHGQSAVNLTSTPTLDESEGQLLEHRDQARLWDAISQKFHEVIDCGSFSGNEADLGKWGEKGDPILVLSDDR